MCKNSSTSLDKLNDTSENNELKFNLDEMKKGLSSKIIDLPKHQSIEERTTWLLEMMEKRKPKRLEEVKEEGYVGSETSDSVG